MSDKEINILTTTTEIILIICLTVAFADLSFNLELFNSIIRY